MDNSGKEYCDPVSIRGVAKDVIENENLKEDESTIKAVERYYKAYKKIQCYINHGKAVDVIFEDERSIVVSALKKIWKNSDYIDLINKANKKNFNLGEFLKLMEDEKNREIFKDIYLDSMKEIDPEYYSFEEEDIDDYIEKVDYSETFIRLNSIKQDIDLLLKMIPTIKDKRNREYLTDFIDEALRESAFKIIDYANREAYLENMKIRIPEFKLLTSMEDLPDYLIDKYKSYNGYIPRGADYSDKSGFTMVTPEQEISELPVNTISEDILDEIVDEYYLIEEQKLLEWEKNKGEMYKRLESIFKNARTFET